MDMTFFSPVGAKGQFNIVGSNGRSVFIPKERVTSSQEGRLCVHFDDVSFALLAPEVGHVFSVKFIPQKLPGIIASHAPRHMSVAAVSPSEVEFV